MNEEFDIVHHTFEALKGLDVPVFYVAKKEVNPPLVVFNISSEKGDVYWENEEQVTRYKIYINIFSRGNFLPIKNKVLKLMKQAGYLKNNIESCQYSELTDLYNQPLSFSFYRENY